MLQRGASLAPSRSPAHPPGSASLVRRTVTKHGKKTVEVVYLITSAADHRTVPPKDLAGWIHRHWGIENRLHWVRDVTDDEDRPRVRAGASARHGLSGQHPSDYCDSRAGTTAQHPSSPRTQPDTNRGMAHHLLKHDPSAALGAQR